MYVGEYHRYPYWGCVEYPPPANRLWYGFLQPYTLNDWTNQLYQCPSYKYETRPAGAPPTYTTPLGNFDVGIAIAMGSYAYRGTGIYPLGMFWTLTARNVATSESMVTAPSDCYAISDSRVFFAASSGKPEGEFILDFSRHLYNELKRRHPAYNVVFCDGHAEAVKRAKLFERSETWARRWFIDDKANSDAWFLFDNP